MLAELTSNGLAILALIISGFAASITLVIAFLNYFAVNEMKRQGNTTLKQTKASILQNCTESYIVARRQRAKAIIDKSDERAKDYYRAICDIYWTEFRLYSEDLIARPIMGAWLHARKRDYENGEIDNLKDEAGHPVTVKCSEVWEKLTQSEYFLKNDPFVEFMNFAHSGEVDKALAIKNAWS